MAFWVFVSFVLGILFVFGAFWFWCMIGCPGLRLW